MNEAIETEALTVGPKSIIGSFCSIRHGGGL
jgi:hypothetical protein